MQHLLPEYYQMVEACIASLGIDPAITKSEKAGQYSLQKGSAPVWVDVFYDSNNQCNYIQVMAPVVQVPATNTLAFYEEIMKTNHNLFGVGFTQFDSWVYLKTIRECDNLQQEEVMAMLNRIGNYADQYDDEFKNKYHNGVSSRKSDD